MTTIPQIQISDQVINRQTQTIVQHLNLLFKNPMTNGVYLTEVSLLTGNNTINHTLDRTLQGWFVVRLRAQAVVSDLQDTNPNPEKTLILEASSNVVVDLFVF